MNNGRFESICADYSIKDRLIFDVDFIHNDKFDDCLDTCLIWCQMIFYGIPFELSDTQTGRIYDGDYQDCVKIGELSGCLILCKQIINNGFEPWDICDASDGDLVYTISALSSGDGPLNVETGGPEQDVFYIHEFQIEPRCDDKVLKGRILNELPKLILMFLHVKPDIIAFYPAPLEYSPDPVEQERYLVIMNIAFQKIDSTVDEKQSHGDNVLKFASAYQFSEDDLNFISRYRDSSYPDEKKDQEEFSFYQAHGFLEAGNSRLLYKIVLP